MVYIISVPDVCILVFILFWVVPFHNFDDKEENPPHPVVPRIWGERGFHTKVILEDYRSIFFYYAYYYSSILNWNTLLL